MTHHASLGNGQKTEKPAQSTNLMVSKSIPHGFSGERIVIVPVPVLKRLDTHPLLRGLKVTAAGFFPNAEGHAIWRPQGASTHLFMACLKGAGHLRVGEDELAAAPGNLFWIPANTPHRYEAQEGNPWSLLWVHFDGEESGAWQQLLFGDSSSLSCSVPAEQLGNLAMDRIHGFLEKGYSLLNLVETASALRFSLGMAARLRVYPGATHSAQTRIQASIEKLNTNWNHLHRIEELAIQAGVSVSHYSTLFRKQTGFSPIDFLIRKKIQHAARLLATTEESITSIASLSGYEDPYYFSRCFRKIMGVSPRDYRKTFLGNT